jgi:hypothetical protein
LGPGRDDTKIIDSYYKEREWRLVPLNGNLSSGSVIRDEKEDSYYYKFKRNDTNMVVTPNDEIRTEVLKFLLGLERETDERLKEFWLLNYKLTRYRPSPREAILEATRKLTFGERRVGHLNANMGLN